jgi:hypothetical protein
MVSRGVEVERAVKTGGLQHQTVLHAGTVIMVPSAGGKWAGSRSVLVLGGSMVNRCGLLIITYHTPGLVARWFRGGS